MRVDNQILTVAQMRGAEDALIAGGSSVEALMELAGRGAADWVWRVAGRHRVTVLCGPGNNGGDGYVIAQALLERGGDAVVVAAGEPRTDAARDACRRFVGKVVAPGSRFDGEVLVDCLFGVGLSRPLASEHVELLSQLGSSHRHRIAIDVPSGVVADTGELLATTLPDYDMTIALGAWKFAHLLMPAAAKAGALRLVGIGVEAIDGAARRLAKPALASPSADAHKYKRGLVAVVRGAMPGAAILACSAAQGAGAGYVKLLSPMAGALPCDLVHDERPLPEALADQRIGAVLIGPGLGRDDDAGKRLNVVLAKPVPTVLDADALMVLKPDGIAGHAAPLIATPHEGELAALEQAFGCDGTAGKPARAQALSQRSGMIIVAKGPDTVIAAPDGRLACADRATSWLSTAGTGDVLAGTIAARLATGAEPFAAACEGVWLHGEAARLCPPAFTAATLAKAIPRALAECL